MEVISAAEGSEQGWVWEVEWLPWKGTRWPEQGPACVTGHLLGGCQSAAQTKMVMQAVPGVSGLPMFLMFSWMGLGSLTVPSALTLVL